jgi:urease accessory protein UreE
MEEYRALFEQRKLAWQVSFEEEEREKERARQAEEAGEKGDLSMEDVTTLPVGSRLLPRWPRADFNG